MKKSGFHWDEYVKRLLDLPNANHITNIEGICIEEGNILFFILDTFTGLRGKVTF